MNRHLVYMKLKSVCISVVMELKSWHKLFTKQETHSAKSRRLDDPQNAGKCICF